jgi:hypothetical protein
MAFDLNVFAQEFGIDPDTLRSKPDVFNKWNGYLSEADTKYSQATQAQREAQDALDRVRSEQAVINEQVEKFALTEKEFDTLRANYASLEAQAKVLKQSGYDLKIPEMPASKPIDPNEQFQNKVVNGFASVSQVLKTINKHQQVTGQPFPEDIEAFQARAAANRMSFYDYAEKQFGYTAKEAEKQAAARKAEVDAAAAAAVAKYKEEHPVTAGNPEIGLSPGASRFPELARRPTPKNHENYGGSPAQRIARSVKRSMEGLAATGS